jgi:hypothetical protein
MPEPVKLNALIEDILKSLTEVNESLVRMAEQDKAITEEVERLTK